MDSFNPVASRWLPAFVLGTAARRALNGVGTGANGDSSDNLWSGPRGPNGNGNVKRPSGPVFRGRRVQIIYAFIDVCFVVINEIVAFSLRFHTSGLRDLFAFEHLGELHRYGGFLLLNVVLILLFCQDQHLYRTPLEQSASTESMATIKAVSFATLLLTAFLYLSGMKIVSRLVVGISALLNMASLVAWRYAKRRFIVRRLERGIGARNALIVGAGSVGQSLAQQFEANKLLGYRFVGFLDARHSGDPRTLGGVEDIFRVARAQFVDEVFVTIPSEREFIKDITLAASRQSFAVNVIPDLYDGLAWNAPLRRIGRFPVMNLSWEPIPGFSLFAKRMVDVALSFLGLILCAPLFAVLAVSIKWNSPGPVLYRSQRVGRKGQIFQCCKLRTMVVNADELKDSLRDRNEREGPFFKISNDPRVTPLGRVLRRFSLDELPQLWNVLVGDMSLVGPRPHPVDDYKQYDLDHLRRLEVKPGITGLWQVTARCDASFESRMRLDLEYIENWNLRLEMELMMRRLSTVARAEGC